MTPGWRLAALLLAVPAALPAAAEVEVENDRQYVGSDGAARIVGEVANGLDYAISGVTVKASHEGGESSSAALARTIPPGMRVPFEIVLDGGARGYDLSAEYAIGVPRSQVIEVTDSRMESVSAGRTMITGTVVNNGDITANGVSVAATLYGRDGGVVGVAWARTGSDYLPSGGEARFVVPVHDVGGEAAAYSIVAESEEYAAVPEFPLGPGLLLAGAAAAGAAAPRLARLRAVRARATGRAAA